MKHFGRFGLLLIFLYFNVVYSGPASKEDPGDLKDNEETNDGNKGSCIETKYKEFGNTVVYLLECDRNKDPGDVKDNEETNDGNKGSCIETKYKEFGNTVVYLLECDRNKENADTKDTKDTTATNKDKPKDNSDTKDTKDTKDATATNKDKPKDNSDTKDTKDATATNKDKPKDNSDTKDTKDAAVTGLDHKDNMCRYKIQILDNEGKCNVKTSSGDRQPMALPGKNGDKGDRGDRGDRGDKGEKGKEGKNGDKADKGQKGEKGETVSTSYVGTHNLICDGVEPPKDPHDQRKLIHVVCDKTTGSKCLKVAPDANTNEYQLSGTNFWLSKDEKFSVDKLYGLQPSKLNYLMEISDEVSINIIVHCKSKIDLEESLKILLWDHHIIGATSTPESPIHYEILKDQNDCKDFTETTEWCKATITLKTLPTLFRDFLFQNIQSKEDQRVKIEIKEVCFKVT